MILLFNPLSTTPGKQPLPLSVMALAAVLEGIEPWTLVDGNLVADPAAAIIGALSALPASELGLLAVTVMPGPQLSQAVPVCRAVRERGRRYRHLVDAYRVDAEMMHDMDFFIAEAKVAELCEGIADLGLRWWGLGRIDTLMRYSDCHVAGDGAFGPDDGVFGHRVGIRCGADQHEQGRNICPHT